MTISNPVLRRLTNASKYSFDGLKALWKEQAFRLEVYSIFITLPVLFVLPVGGLLKLVLLLLMPLVLVVEALNTGIEAVVDRISPDKHPLSKTAKDVASAAVFIAIMMNIIAWLYAIYTATAPFM